MKTSVCCFALLSLLSIMAGCRGPTIRHGTVNLPFPLEARVTRADLEIGDELSITSLQGDSLEYRAGATYRVSGRYRLQSREEAHLMQWCADGWVQEDPGREPEPEHGGRLRIRRGEGEFSFLFKVKEAGDLHVSLYPVAGGESFGSLYYVPMEQQ